MEVTFTIQIFEIDNSICMDVDPGNGRFEHLHYPYFETATIAAERLTKAFRKQLEKELQRAR